MQLIQSIDFLMQQASSCGLLPAVCYGSSMHLPLPFSVSYYTSIDSFSCLWSSIKPLNFDFILSTVIILHASLRTPNLKARLNTFREEFRAVWRNYSEL